MMKLVKIAVRHLNVKRFGVVESKLGYQST